MGLMRPCEDGIDSQDRTKPSAGLQVTAQRATARLPPLRVRACVVGVSAGCQSLAPANRDKDAKSHTGHRERCCVQQAQGNHAAPADGASAV